jgi:DNA-binding MarR family transcriptional regulator
MDEAKMNKSQPASNGDLLSNLMLDLFRLNSRLLAAGDRLVAPIGLTSARWQILGTIVHGDHPQPVAWLARNLGANRQNVQRIVNALHDEGLITFETNPHHKRAQLVVLTAKGKRAYEAAMGLQVPWINHLADGLRGNDIKAMHDIITTLREKLERDEDDEE